MTGFNVNLNYIAIVSNQFLSRIGRHLNIDASKLAEKNISRIQFLTNYPKRRPPPTLSHVEINCKTKSAINKHETFSRISTLN
jgi:hypothetical protein